MQRSKTIKLLLGKLITTTCLGFPYQMMSRKFTIVLALPMKFIGETLTNGKRKCSNQPIIYILKSGQVYVYF